jgi:hypothetical protein
MLSQRKISTTSDNSKLMPMQHKSLQSGKNDKSDFNSKI